MSLSWLPNAISIIRIALVPPILWLLLNSRPDIALLLFFVAGFSDGLDGYLATRFAWDSRAGALLDPIADKLLVAGTFVALSVAGLLPVWLAAIVIMRDVVIVGGAMAYNFLVRPVEGEPTRISKINTGLEFVFLVFVMSEAGYGWPDRITLIVVGAAVLVTVVISGCDYVWNWIRSARSGA